jgi:RNA polymerase sigma-70 factor (ECF subfamily)
MRSTSAAPPSGSKLPRHKTICKQQTRNKNSRPAPIAYAQRLCQNRELFSLVNASQSVRTVSSAQSPHSDLVGALYRDHRGWLLAWLRRNVTCPQRAEDLSQDTFVRLLGRDELREPREPRAFLVAIAKGLLFDYFRRAALEQAYLTELMLIPEGEQPSIEEQQLILEDLKAIDRLLGKLSSKARAAFLYNRLDGLGHAQIAERLGVSVPRVRQYLAQGIRQCYIALYGEPA